MVEGGKCLTHLYFPYGVTDTYRYYVPNGTKDKINESPARDLISVIKSEKIAIPLGMIHRGLFYGFKNITFIIVNLEFFQILFVLFYESLFAMMYLLVLDISNNTGCL